jgi:hypothetical protein
MSNSQVVRKVTRLQIALECTIDSRLRRPAGLIKAAPGQLNMELCEIMGRGRT